MLAKYVLHPVYVFFFCPVRPLGASPRKAAKGGGGALNQSWAVPLTVGPNGQTRNHEERQKAVGFTQTLRRRIGSDRVVHFGYLTPLFMVALPWPSVQTPRTPYHCVKAVSAGQRTPRRQDAAAASGGTNILLQCPPLGVTGVQCASPGAWEDTFIGLRIRRDQANNLGAGELFKIGPQRVDILQHGCGASRVPKGHGYEAGQMQ